MLSRAKTILLSTIMTKPYILAKRERRRNRKGGYERQERGREGKRKGEESWISPCM